LGLGFEEKRKRREGSHCMGRLATRQCLVEVDRGKGDDSQKARREDERGEKLRLEFLSGEFR
jgi:hypothetical protein